MTVLSCSVEASVASAIQGGKVNICTIGDQQLDHRQLSIPRCAPDRGSVKIVPVIHIHLFPIQNTTHDCEITVGNGVVELFMNGILLFMPNIVWVNVGTRRKNLV